MKAKFTNALIKESSPYLLQHAHNPVHWFPWKDGILQHAQELNKPLLISIGYAACHWCHVMEKESFEDEEVAAMMNTHFINIKIDREERPDIDHIYMSALQLMTGSGGWPLNIVALPDAKPFWGGTYLKKQEWLRILHQLSTIYKTKPDKVQEYAKALQQGIIRSNTIVSESSKTPIHFSDIEKAVKTWATYFDHTYGGTQHVPKFMMPVNLEFLLYYGTYTQDKNTIQHIETTLTKMAYGGIFDHVGGGFSRYAVDERWHIPHFEKMLYDNAQLVSLYSKAYSATKNELYKTVVEKTLQFIQKELTHNHGGCYSSLDADSLNEKGIQEEGVFYIWTKAQLKTLLKEDFSIFAEYFNINDFGLWEGNNYVLIRNASEEEIAKKQGCSLQELRTRINKSLQLLSQERKERARPRLDDKILTCWNAMMLKGYANAYKAFSVPAYLDTALKKAQFLLQNQYKEDGSLYHSFKDGKGSINGFLEDYAAVSEAFVILYEASGDEKWLTHAQTLIHYCYDHFYDQESGFFSFTHVRDTVIITKTFECKDNVIPASNSIIAKVLFKLSRYFHEDRYLETAQHMLYTLKEDVLSDPYIHANWLSLAMYFCAEFYEVAISGKRAYGLLRDLNHYYLPHTIIAASETKTALPLLKHRYIEDATYIYICKNNSCKLPVTTIKEALTQLCI